MSSPYLSSRFTVDSKISEKTKFKFDHGRLLGSARQVVPQTEHTDHKDSLNVRRSSREMPLFLSFFTRNRNLSTYLSENPK
jgi:hypothetical protein